jgi:Plasmid pRiA4b ORF-3-like protein
MDPKNTVLQYKITLIDIEPEIWRRIVVPATYSFWDLHVAIQDSMGWLDYHLHEFQIVNPDTGQTDRIGIPDDEPIDDGLNFLPGWELSLVMYFRQLGIHAKYKYDFGDGWKHDVLLEGILIREPKSRYPKCIDGARACPPEDCGGVHGYFEMLRIINDKTDVEHKSMLEWVGKKYNPKIFDPKLVRFDNPKKRWKIAFSGD